MNRPDPSIVPADRAAQVRCSHRQDSGPVGPPSMQEGSQRKRHLASSLVGLRSARTGGLTKLGLLTAAGGRTSAQGTCSTAPSAASASATGAEARVDEALTALAPGPGVSACDGPCGRSGCAPGWRRGVTRRHEWGAAQTGARSRRVEAKAGQRGCRDPATGVQKPRAGNRASSAPASAPPFRMAAAPLSCFRFDSARPPPVCAAPRPGPPRHSAPPAGRAAERPHGPSHAGSPGPVRAP